MAITSSKYFSDIVIRGRGKGLPALSSPGLRSHPLLEPALRFGAALAYEKYLAGQFGSPKGMPSGIFVTRALDVVDNLVMGMLGGELGSLGWTAGGPNRHPYKLQLIEVFEVCKV